MTTLLALMRGAAWLPMLAASIFGGAVALGLRKMMHREAEESFHGAAGPLTSAVVELTGRMASAEDRLERLRGDLALTTGQARKALIILDDLRENR